MYPTSAKSYWSGHSDASSTRFHTAADSLPYAEAASSVVASVLLVGGKGRLGAEAASVLLVGGRGEIGC